MANVPAGLKYTREHEWAKVEGDRARIGITAFAQEQLGEAVDGGEGGADFVADVGEEHGLEAVGRLAEETAEDSSPVRGAGMGRAGAPAPSSSPSSSAAYYPDLPGHRKHTLLALRNEGAPGKVGGGMLIIRSLKRSSTRSTRCEILISGRAPPRTELIVKNHLTRHGAVCVAGWNKLPSSRCEHRESGKIAV